MSADTPAHAARPGAERHHAHHFESLAVQTHAARLGMWIFLGTEILLFGGLFAGYTFYRSLFPEAFDHASRHLNTVFGTIETFDLITSSFFMALSIYLVRAGRSRAAAGALVLTILMGLAFLGLHSVEYLHEFHEGALPGRFYHFAELPIPGAAMFYTLYFLMTGLHSIHVIAGVAVLLVMLWRTLHGGFSPAYHTPLELGGLYWHLVDLIWIFLFPLLYLA
jgi:cytochrome c oxidase subunit 3